MGRLRIIDSRDSDRIGHGDVEQRCERGVQAVAGVDSDCSRHEKKQHPDCRNHLPPPPGSPQIGDCDPGGREGCDRPGVGIGVERHAERIKQHFADEDHDYSEKRTTDCADREASRPTAQLSSTARKPVIGPPCRQSTKEKISEREHAQSF